MTEIFWRKVVLFIALLFGAQPALSGEWTFFPRTDAWTVWNGECSAQFTGPILRGDLTDAYTSGRLENQARICLDSPGGNLMEVYDFIQLFENADAESDDPFVFSTRVRSGDECLSACAILFMFGESYGANSPSPDRILDRGARLGFHSPFIDPAAAQTVDSASAFAGAVSIANLLVANAYRQVTTSGAVLPPELLSIILGTPPDDMYFVRHLAELSILGIRTDMDLTMPEVALTFDRPSIEAAMRRICATSYVVENRNWFVTDGYDFSDLIRFSRRYSSPDGVEVLDLVHRPDNGQGYASDTVIGVLTGPYFVPGWYSSGARLYCMVELQGEVDGDIMRVSNHYVNINSMHGYSGIIPYEQHGSSPPSYGLVPIDTLYE